MLSCESCQYIMADAIYDQIDDTRQQALHNHLAACADCRAIHKDLLAANASLQQAGVSRQTLDDIPERASLDAIWDRLEPALDRASADGWPSR